MFTHSKHKLFWNEVHTTCRTFLPTCCRCRAGDFSDHEHWIETLVLFSRHLPLISVQIRLISWQLGPIRFTYRLLTKVFMNLMENYKFFTEKHCQKWSMHSSNNQNSFTTRLFVMITLYKRVKKLITSMLIHCKHDLYWNEVHSTCGGTVLFRYRRCSVHGLGGIGEPKVRPCFGIGPCIGRGRNMDWDVSEKPKYDRVFVSGLVEHGLIPIPKPVPRHVWS